ncbi:MAG: protein kinase [Planctomycetes bacterium]|nr:protein kinase [Planctomycetota bacterium]
MLEEELARGGQGVVYRARGPAGPVAIKLLLDLDPRAQRRFRQEAAVLLRVNHPHALRGVELGEEGGRLYLVSELIEGEDLQRTVRREGTPNPAAIRAWLAPIAEALEHCHGLGLVHRDLKPSNVLVERGSGRTVVVDFGLVARDAAEFGRLSIDDFSRLSLSGEIHGTPSYMAPEQADPAFGEVGPRTDVYGLGGILYFLLTGEAPYRGTTSVHVLSKLLDSSYPAPDPGGLAPGAPEDLLALCAACLARDPARRPASAAAVALALKGQAPHRARWPQGARRALARGGALALAAVAAGVWALWPAAKAPPAPQPYVSPPPEAVEAQLARCFEAAKRELREDRPEVARGWLRTARSLRPADPLGLYLTAEVALQLHDSGAALEALTRLPDDAALPEAFWLRGKLRVDREDLEGAAPDLDRAVALSPQDLRFRLSRAMLSRRLERHEAALADLERVLAQGTPDLTPFLLRMECLAALKRFAEVDATLALAVEALPTREDELLASRAGVGRANGDLAGAEAALDRLLELAPTNLSALEARVDVGLLLGHLLRASDAAARYHRLDPEGYLAPTLRGRFAFFSGMFNDAVAEFRKARERTQSARSLELLWLRAALAYHAEGKVRDAHRAATNACNMRSAPVWGPLWLAGLGGDRAPLRPLLDGQAPWLQALAEAMQRGTFDREAILSRCPSARERTIALGFLGLLAEREGDGARATELYEACRDAGYSTVLPYEWAVFRAGANRR